MIPIDRSPNSQFANDLGTPKRMDDLKRLKEFPALGKTMGANSYQPLEGGGDHTISGTRKDLHDKAAGMAMPFNT